MGIYYSRQSNDSDVILEQQQVGYEPKPKTKTSDNDRLWTIFRSLLYVVELGTLILFPKLGATAQLLIGLVSGAGQQAIDVASGHANLQSSFINFASPVLAYFPTRALNLRQVKKIISNADDYALAVAKLQKAGLSTEAIATTLTRYKVIASADDIIKAQKAVKTIKDVQFNAQKAREYGYYAFTKGLNKADSKVFEQGLKSLRRDVVALGALGITLQAEKKFQKSILQRIGYRAKEIDKFLKTMHSHALSPAQKNSYALGWIRNSTLKQFTPGNATRQAKLIANAFKRGKLLVNEAYQLVWARQFVRATQGKFGRLPSLSAKTARAQTTKQLKTFIDVLKKPSSRKFNDWVTQPTQAIFDPNDLGRAPVEFLYRKLKHIISNSKWWRPLKNLQKIDDAFAKAGGIVVDSSWHLGYKKITNYKGIPNWVQISYGKDTGKLRQVYVLATNHELRWYRARPGSYYLRKWAFSKGGKKLSLDSIFGFSGNLKARVKLQSRAVLSFVNNQALRNILSIVSNVVENTTDIVRGVYKESYFNKMSRSFQRIAVNRSFRLMTRVVAGGYAKKLLGYNVGSVIGRELQRVGTNILAPMVNNFIRNSQRQRQGLKPLTRTPFTSRSLINKALIGLGSNVRRIVRSRARNNSVLLNSITVARKAKIVGRLPNAITPKRPYKGIRYRRKK